jgi:AraC-like DNA-binding protein
MDGVKMSKLPPGQKTVHLRHRIGSLGTSYDYHCPGQVSLVNLHMSPSGIVEGAAGEISFNIIRNSADGTALARAGQGRVPAGEHFKIVVPGTKVSGKWQAGGKVDIMSLILAPTPELDWLVRAGSGLAAQAEAMAPFAIGTMRAISENFALDKSFGRLFAETATASLLYHAQLRIGDDVGRRRNIPGRAEIAAALDFIHDRFAEPISLGDMVAATTLSSGRFIQTFKRVTGLPPHQYIMRLRVARAKDLLARSDLTLAQIAADSGFYDQSRLTMSFSKATGLTPAKFRKQLT